ncbi:MAG TPA: FAD-binding oxidoreductase [Steroidobacteraceae bacterium]|nr:FAD-binding oxidoreductase [Steroidobacteraceae bacterium]
MKRREFLRAASAAGSAWLPWRRGWAAGQAAVSLSGSAIHLPGNDIAELAASLEGTLLLPTDSRYERARRVWNGSINKRPALIASCAGAADVAHAVDFAREHGLLTAVRAGGHSTSGKSTCDGGIMIDLSPMRGVRVDPATRTAYLQAGTLLGQFDRECTFFGLATTAGTVSNTGAAGLTLGGGFGRLGSRFGLACDNLKGADVVTAGGRLVHASEQENQELLWGLRGGGGNFGVVTSLEYRLHPMNPVVLGGMLNWTFEHAREVLEFYAEYVPSKPDELCTDLFLRSVPAGQPGISIMVCWSADHAAGERALESLRTLARTAQGAVVATPYVRLQSIFDAGFPDGRRYYQKSGLVSTLTSGAIDMLLEVFQTPRNFPLTVQLQGMGGAAHRVKPTDTAFFHREALWDMDLITSWEDPHETDAHIAGMHDVWARLEPLTKGFYVNSRYEDDLKAFRENYGDNYPRLVKLKDRYDPTNLFRLNANVVPSRL